MTPNFTRYSFLFLFLLSLFIRPNTTQAQSFSESFNDIATLAGSGWLIQNNSTPVGSISWFQGTATTATPTPGPFNSNSGAANAYIGVNYNSTGSTGTISNWLITPNRTIRNGDVLTFYTRKPTIGAGQTDYPDRLEVRLSTNGASTNAGANASGTGDFTTLLLSVNPTLVANVYPQVWTKYTITISGLPAPTSGRFAFRYYVTGAGSLGSASDYIGIDDVEYTPYVCPAFTLTTGGALTGGTAGVAYSKSLTQTGALGPANFAITAGALPPGTTLGANGTISGTPTATGTFNFIVTASDASGCSGSQAYSITIICGSNPISFTPPNPVCGNMPLTLATFASPAGGSFSGTGVSGNVFDPSAGSQTITYDYTDAYGCAFSSSKTLTVADPGVTTVTPATQSISSGTAITTIEVASTISGTGFTWTRDNTSEVTGIDASGTGNISGTLTNTTDAPVTVTFTITSTTPDGCDKTVMAEVVVNPAPTVTPPSNIVISNVSNTCSSPATYTATAGGTPAPTITYSFSGATTGSGIGTGSGAQFNVGVTTVTLTATNTWGTSSSSFTVTVNDVQAPSISCPAAVTVNCAGEVPAANINSVTASDNCQGVTVTFVDDVISNQTCDNRYTITRTYRATDAAGNSSTCSQTITVDDQTKPVITCPAPINVTATGSCATIVNFTVTATDNCGGTVNIETIPASGSSFPIGTTTVTSTATDACGNTETCSFTVTVADGQKPTITTAVTDRAVCEEKDATFTIAASNTSIQWQQLQGNNWEDIANANGSAYTISNVTPAENGNRYRVKLEGLCETIYTQAVTLSIHEPIAPVITTPASVCVEDKNIQLLATPAGGTFSGLGVTGNNWNLQIPALGTHTISYTTTDANGCTTSTTKAIKLDFCSVTNSVQAFQGYPNPTRGKTSVRTLITEDGKYNLIASDLNGRPFWRKEVEMRKGWNIVDVDLTSQKAGMYVITISKGSSKAGDIKLIKID